MPIDFVDLLFWEKMGKENLAKGIWNVISNQGLCEPILTERCKAQICWVGTQSLLSLPSWCPCKQTILTLHFLEFAEFANSEYNYWGYLPMLQGP